MILNFYVCKLFYYYGKLLKIVFEFNSLENYKMCFGLKSMGFYDFL